MELRNWTYLSDCNDGRIKNLTVSCLPVEVRDAALIFGLRSSLVGQ
ncbi:hypothetical protein [Deinococcus rubellus]